MTPAPICSAHPEAPAVNTCARCGRFVCAPCVAIAEPPICAACEELWKDPLGILGQHFSVGASLRNGARVLLPVLPSVVALTLMFAIPSAALVVGLRSEHPGPTAEIAELRTSVLYDTFIGLFCDLACLALFIGVAEGRRLTLFQSLREAAARWGRTLGARIRAGLWMAAAAVFLLLPGVWKGVQLQFSMESAVRGTKGDPLDQSTELVHGQWWRAFAFVLVAISLSFLPAMIAIAGVEAGSSAIGLDPIVHEVATTWLESLAGQLFNAFSLAAFYGLVRTSGRALPPMRWQTGDVG